MASRSGWPSCTSSPGRGALRDRLDRRPRDQPRLAGRSSGRSGGTGRDRGPRGRAPSGDLAVRGRGGRDRAGRGRGRARLHRPSRPPARTRQRGRGDGGFGPRGRRSRWIHDGLRDAEHGTRAGRAERAGTGPCGRRRIRLAGRAAGPRRGDGRPGGGATRGHRRAGRRRRGRLLRRWVAGSLGPDPAGGPGLCGCPGIAGGGSRRGLVTHGRRRGA